MRVFRVVIWMVLPLWASGPPANETQQPRSPKSAAEEISTQTQAAESTAASVSSEEASNTNGRTDLNLLGKTDTDSGESRRNENVQFNPIDNNALKELNRRLGATATVVPTFEADQR